MKTLKIFIFVVVMGTVSSLLLVGVNSFTLPLIAKKEELKIKGAVLDVLEIPSEKSALLSVFDHQVKVTNIDKRTFYSSREGSVAFDFAGPGLWGPISGIVSFLPDLKTIKLIKILHQEETPGLGARIAEADYLKQFRHKEIFPKLVFMSQGKAKEKNEVDAITGATGSSKALEKLLNETLQKNISLLKK